jgi:hypothetical protein
VFPSFQDDSCILEKVDVSDCSLLVNLFGSEGKPGKVEYEWKTDSWLAGRGYFVLLI